MPSIKGSISAIFSCVEGNVATIFAAAAPLVFGGVALAIDTTHLHSVRSSVQSIADNAALATVKELHVFASNSASMESTGRSRVESLLAEARLADREHTVSVQVDKTAGTAQVDIAIEVAPLLPFLSSEENPIRVAAKAEAFGQASFCILTLHASAEAAFRSKDVGVVAAPDCGVQSNSTNSKGMVVETGGTIISKHVCSLGGVIGSPLSFVPGPAETDCVAIKDPLSSRNPPPVGGCDSTKEFSVGAGSVTIYPGVYCGGLKIGGGATVTAQPGTYVIKGGKLAVGQNATLQGENVTFYFEDDKALFEFADKSTVDLSAPKDGEMAGMLFFENRASSPDRKFSITSGNVRKLLGTIYLPRAILFIDAKGNIAAESAYTVIISRQLDLKAAKLVVNADFNLTDVPKPLGLVSDEVGVRLSR